MYGQEKFALMYV